MNSTITGRHRDAFAYYLAARLPSKAHVQQLGLVSAIFPELSFIDLLATCRREGYSCVEVMCWPPGAAERRYAGVTHIDVLALGESAADRIRTGVAEHGVSISALGYYPNPLSPDTSEASQAAQHLRAVIKAAATLGVHLVTTFVGRDWTRSVAENWPRFLSVWPELIRFAEERNVRVAIENCPMLFTDDEWPGGKNLATTPTIWRKMFDAIPSQFFGLNYDPSHFVWQMMDEVHPIREFGSRILHAHAKDAALDRLKLDEVGISATPLSYHQPRLPGLGDVRWGKYFAALTSAGYRGPVCVEVEDRAFESSFADRVLAVRQSRRFLSQFFPLGTAA